MNTITEQEFKNILNSIYNKCVKTNNIKQAIAEAVEFGMQYREQQIRDGINIVFNALHMQQNT